MNIINNQPIVNYNLRNNNLSNKPLSMPKLQNSLDKVSFKGNEKFGCIYLGEDVRSETSKMFADLFEK